MLSGSKKLAEFKSKISADSSARKRLEFLFDEGEYTELDAFVKNGDDLAGVITAYGFVEGSPVYAFSQDKTVKNGAVNKAQASKIAKIYELAAKTGIPVIGIHDSDGAFIDDGADSLFAYGEMMMWTSNVSGVVPQISVIAGTCAGSAAVFACSSDFVIMTENSEFFMAVPSNSKTEGAGSAKNAAKSGTAALVLKDDKEAMAMARKLVSMLPMNNLSPIPMFEFSESGLAIGKDAASIVASIADAGSVTELYADFGKASFTAFASVSGATVGFAATNKTSDKLTADDSSKLSRFLRICDAFSVPVITIVDSEGFEVSAENELSGSIREIAKLAHSYAEATTVKVAVVAGKAYGPVFTALAGKNANSDMTFAYPDAVISPIAPEAAVEFLSHDKLKGASDVAKMRSELADEYASEKASAFSAAEKGCIDDIIEPIATRQSIISALEVLAGKRVSRLSKKHSNIPM
ncbi:MAG TPA: carboxyl transferase domain-containing protein [Oscillospiraceae bacterium]|nr:carboxyl transferase domain-containing protein [Oscillospiraceae bacterium]